MAESGDSGEETSEWLSDNENQPEANRRIFFDDDRPPQRLKFFPFAYALFNEYLKNHCWYCLAESTSLKRCSGCSCAFFCNRRCHVLGWKDHRIECKGLRNSSEVPNIEIRLLGRIVVRFKAIKDGKDKAEPTFYINRTSKRNIMEIWGHTDKIRQDSAAMKKFEDIYRDLLLFYGVKHLLTKEEIFELHCRDFINRHAISDKAYLQEIGKGLYLDLCAYDHSCSPNSIYTCDGFVATLRGLNLAVNLEDRNSTFYSYIDLLSSKQQRHKLLKDTWYFDCQCERCTDPGDDFLTSMLCPNCPVDPEALQIFGTSPYKDPVTQMIKCPKCECVVPQGRVLEAINAMRFIDRLIEKEEVQQLPEEEKVPFLEDLMRKFKRILSPFNVYFCKIVQMLIPLTPPSDYKTLLDLHLLSEKCVRFCFPPNHPAVAFHLRNIGVFFLKTGNPHKAHFYLETSQYILDFTLDPEHPMAVENRSFFEEAKEEINLARQLILQNAGIPKSGLTRTTIDMHDKVEGSEAVESSPSLNKSEVTVNVVEANGDSHMLPDENEENDLPELLR